MLASSVTIVTTACDNTDAATSFEITDGTGETFGYDSAADKVIVAGLGATLTVTELGEIDKIVAVDKYSLYSYNSYSELEDLTTDTFGTIYTSNTDYFVSYVLDLVDSGTFSLDDTIILTGSSNATNIRDILSEEGFTHIIIYTTITDYSDIVEFVKNVSLIVTGSVSSIVSDMEAVQETINEGLESVETEANGLYVSYYYSALMVGNTDMIGVSLLDCAGGNNIGYDSSKASKYGDENTIVSLLGEYPDTVVFIDANYFSTYTIEDFRNDVLGGDTSITLIEMDPLWNNYCPEAAEGLWTFACALYPDLFSGDIPTSDTTSSGDNVVIYAMAAIIVIAAIAIMMYAYSKKTN